MKSLHAFSFLITVLPLTAQAPFEVPPPIPGENGTELRLFAREPFLRNTVAVAVGEDGKVYATSVVRRKAADLDIRQFRSWVEQDLSLRTVEEKRAFLRGELTAGNSNKYRRVGDQNKDGVIDWRDLTVLTDRILVLEDTDGDGVADRSDVFAEGFNTEVTGIAAGLEAWDDTVYATVEPDLLRFKNTGGDPAADQREVLATGFSVHIAYAGHNFSGPVVGPDGRLYMSSPDKGMSVTSREGRRFSHPLSGTVARCELDGSNFEVFAHGLRNAQEIAFDQLGNLFAVDNDGDQKGEKERLVYITKGSDHGWRYHWQYRGKDYQPWMVEGLSRPDHPGRPAFSTPPLHLYHDGPAGFAFNPGTALNPHYANHFFMTGFPARKLHAFQLKPRGASFEISGDHVAASGVLMVGLDFGPDGALYLADWSARGYELNEKGGVWKFDDPRYAGSDLRQKTAALLRADWSQPTVAKVIAELGHPDQRVRMKAQFELVRRHQTDRLMTVAQDDQQAQRARVHAIWGLGQHLRLHGKEFPDTFTTLYRDKDPVIRAQAARTAGDSGHPELISPAPLTPLLKDPAEQPRFFAALALGSLEDKEAFNALVAYLERDGAAPYHRHAGVMGLAGCGSPEQLGSLSGHPSQNVRLAAVVALRRIASPLVAAFLDDEDPPVVTEAARAIYDDHAIAAALPALAALLDEPAGLTEATIRRALGSALRLRNPEQAARVASFAALDSQPGELRLAALRLLREWPRPPALDSVQGRHQELRPVSAASLSPLLKPFISQLLESEDKAISEAAREAGAVFGLGMDPQELLALVKKDDPERSPSALNLLASTPDRQGEAALVALKSRHPSIRAAALKALAGLTPQTFPDYAREILAGSEDLVDRRAALAGLPSNKQPAARELLADSLRAVREGKTPSALVLDVLETVRASGDATLKKDLTDYLATLPDKTLAPYQGTLHGGDPLAGRDLFNNHLAAQCIRCHAVGPGGSEVGPNLAEVGKKDPSYLLASLIEPGRDIAAGFGLTSLTLQDGTTVAGTLASENTDRVTLLLPSGSEQVVARSEITAQSPPVSSMPPMGSLLTKREIRDLLAYLQSLP